MYNFADEPTLVQLVGGSSAPWWGVPVIAGGFLIAGAILGFVFNIVLEKRKQASLTATRWNDDIRLMSAEVFAAAEDLLRVRTHQADKSKRSPRRSAVDKQCKGYTDAIAKLASNLYLIAPNSLSIKIQTLSVAVLLCEQNKTTAQNFPLKALSEAKSAVREHLGASR